MRAPLQLEIVIDLVRSGFCGENPTLEHKSSCYYLGSLSTVRQDPWLVVSLEARCLDLSLSL